MPRHTVTLVAGLAATSATGEPILTQAGLPILTQAGDPLLTQTSTAASGTSVLLPSVTVVGG